jgi:hypothetical protein
MAPARLAMALRSAHATDTHAPQHADTQTARALCKAARPLCARVMASPQHLLCGPHPDRPDIGVALEDVAAGVETPGAHRHH